MARTGFGGRPGRQAPVRPPRPSVSLALLTAAAGALLLATPQALSAGERLPAWATTGHATAASVAASESAASAATPGAPGESPLDSLRTLYYAAVQEESVIRHGLGAVDSLRVALAPPDGSPLASTLLAYEGALVTLRAKHGFWPHDRLRHLRAGLALLDRAVAGHPEVAEIRYLRLMSCFYLPGILGRKGSVREDFAWLAELLPAARGDYPPELFAAIVRFVLENGEPTVEQRDALHLALEGESG